MKKIGHTIKRRRFIPFFLLAFIFVAIGGVLAFNSESLIFQNIFHTIYQPISFTEKFVPPKDWKTCDEKAKEATITNEGSSNAKARVSYIEYWLNKDESTNLPLINNGVRLAVINFQNENDWEDGGDGWYYWKGVLAPGETTSSYFKSVTYNCEANMSTEPVCVETATGTDCSTPDSPYDEATYHLDITLQAVGEDDPFPADTSFSVTIDPNQGKYNGSSEIYTQRVRPGTTIDLSNTSRENYELENWIKNDSNTYTGSSIVISENTTLVANWLSLIYHTVTVDPNGGSYDGASTESHYDVREGSDYSILDAKRDNYALDHWEYVGGELDGQVVSSSTIENITNDVAVKAVWLPAVAKIERTSKLYPSIMRAEAEAITDDIITLLVDTVEDVTNEKTVTLNLNEHTVTGSLTNTAAGNITLIDGEINNPNGIAVTNNGTLTMGVNDYKADGKVNIDNTYIRLIGTTTGIKQNGVFNFYDGFLEGDVGLEGGYNDAPFYRTTDEGIVRYFPLVDHIGNTERQHVELANADLAVSKTTVGGDIYYYNLQDNINTSVRTGYQIYIVRNFDASYPIISRQNTSANIDLVGYTVNTGDDITINGTLNFTDSGSEADPSNKGKMTVRQTITVNDGGVLNLDKIVVEEITVNTLLQNYGAVNLTNGSTLASTNGVVMIADDNNNIPTMDATSKLSSSSSSNATIINRRSADKPLNITGGTITSAAYRAISNSDNAKVNITGGTVSATNNASAAIYGGSTTINGGTVSANIYSGSAVAGTVTLESGSVTARGTGTTYAISNCGGTTKIKNGTVSVESNGSVVGISCNTEITAGTITATSHNSEARGAAGYITVNGGSITSEGHTNTYGIDGSGPIGSQNTVTVTAGTISATSAAGNSYGIAVGNAGFTVKGGAITSTSTSSDAYGVQADGFYVSAHGYVEGGTITATTNHGTGYGMTAKQGYVTGGKITGSTYGVYSVQDTLRIGTNDKNIHIDTPEIIGASYGLAGNSFHFYDGVLRGAHAYSTGIIKAIPDGSVYNIESSANYAENCWLVAEEDYLQVGTETFNSLTEAYEKAAEGDGIVKVIRDALILAVLPTNPSGTTVTIDLNGHALSYAQSLTNEGIMYITDSTPTHAGSLSNPNSGIPTISNSGTVNIDSGTITSAAYRAISNSDNAKVNITGGTVSATNNASAAIYGGSTTINGGTVSANIYSGSAVAGTVTLESGSVTARGTGTTYAISNCGGTTKIKNGTVSVESNGSVVGISCNTEITAGTITATSHNSEARGAAGYITVNGGSITSEGHTNTYGIDGSGPIGSQNTVTVTAGTISATSAAGNSYGIAVGNAGFTVKGGAITSTSTSSDAYGVQADGFYVSAHGYVEGGTITATTNHGTGYGMTAKQGYVTGGKITGSTYGVYSVQDTLRIGTNDKNIHIDTPEIIGASYGLAGNSFHFYDGVLKGTVNAYTDGVVKAIADDATIYIGEETVTVDGVQVKYYKRYLIDEYDVAKIGTEIYTSLQDAVDDAETGDLIELIDDNYIFESLTIPTGKQFTIETHDKKIIMANPILNSGKVKIINTNPVTNPELSLSTSQYVIYNSANSELEIVNIPISSAYAIENSGKLTLDNMAVTSSNTAIKNLDTLIVKNGAQISGQEYAVYSAGTKASIANSSLSSASYAYYQSNSEDSSITGSNINGILSNTAGKLNVTSSTLARSGDRQSSFIINSDSGELILDDVTASYTHDVPSCGGYCGDTIAISNSNKLTFKNSTFTETLTGAVEKNSYLVKSTGNELIVKNSTFTSNTDNGVDMSNNVTRYGIYNGSGTVTLSDNTISINSTNPAKGKTQGIHNESGNISLLNDTVSVTGSEAYGIHNNNGSVTLGEAEPDNSPDRGKATAHVSITSPNISANGSTSGIGVKNISGRFNYFDGIIFGTTAALPETPTLVEYKYEPKFTTDENGNSCILIWMPGGN